MKTKTNPICRDCGVELNDENWYSSWQKTNNHLCKTCHKERMRQWRKANPEKIKENVQRWRKANPVKAKAQWTRRNRKQGKLLMSENRGCSSFLGVYVAEGVLGQAFKNVVRMPYGNSGYDFKCGNGYEIDVKSSCWRKNGGWAFHIDHNIIADYFLCLAFDNRKDLNPLHVWLIPGDVVNSRICIGISPSTISKWDKYALDINKVSACCNMMKAI